MQTQQNIFDPESFVSCQFIISNLEEMTGSGRERPCFKYTYTCLGILLPNIHTGATLPQFSHAVKGNHLLFLYIKMICFDFFFSFEKQMILTAENGRKVRSPGSRFIRAQLSFWSMQEC